MARGGKDPRLGIKQNESMLCPESARNLIKKGRKSNKERANASKVMNLFITLALCCTLDNVSYRLLAVLQPLLKINCICADNVETINGYPGYMLHPSPNNVLH